MDELINMARKGNITKLDWTIRQIGSWDMLEDWIIEYEDALTIVITAIERQRKAKDVDGEIDS